MSFAREICVNRDGNVSDPEVGSLTFKLQSAFYYASYYYYCNDGGRKIPG